MVYRNRFNRLLRGSRMGLGKTVETVQRIALLFTGLKPGENARKGFA